MSIVKDMSLAPTGHQKIEWVRDFMPALSGIEERFRREKPFEGLTIAVSVHLEAKTANLGLVLREGGAEVHLTGCNPLSTQDDVAAALAAGGEARLSPPEWASSRYRVTLTRTAGRWMISNLQLIEQIEE